jgi:RNA methyltransferase, TrmH family
MSKRPHGERAIASPGNASVRTARALEKDRAFRESERTYLAWGIHLAQEALTSGAAVREALIGPRLEDSFEGREILSRLRRSSTPLARTTTRILDSIVEGCGDQGILLLVTRPEHDLSRVLARPGPALILAAHGVQDPGNLGSIVRTARALGAGALIALEGTADPFGSRAVRAAMGAQFTLAIVSSASQRCLTALSAAGIDRVAADPAGTRLPTEVDLTRPIALLMGSEGSGLPRRILEDATSRVRIPMAPGVSSINVHAAAAVLLYEAARQRGFTPIRAPGPGPRGAGPVTARDCGRGEA